MTVQLLNNPPINQTIKPDNVSNAYQNHISQGTNSTIQNGNNMQIGSVSSPPAPAGCGSNLNVSA